MILHRRRRQFFLFVVDFLLLYVSLFLALWIRSGAFPSMAVWRHHVYPFSAAFIIWAVTFYSSGLYILDISFIDLKFLARLIISVGLSSLFTAFYFYLLKDPDISPKTILFLFSGIALVLIWAWRYSYSRSYHTKSVRFMVAFIGGGPDVEELRSALLRLPHLGLECAGVYPTDFDAMAAFGRGADAQARIPDIFVIKESPGLTAETRRFLFSLVGTGPSFIALADFYELVLRRVPIGTINDLWFLDKVDILDKKSYLAVKRGVDILLALLVLILAAPFMLLAALSIRLGSRGPVIYKQVRLGRRGKAFTIWKFRTMRVEGNDGAPTSVGDSRVTTAGKIMRALRIDELPQMVNILRGDMSFIGPRPERPELASELAKAIPFYMERHLVKPGVTGWDQVSGEYHSPSIEDTYKKLQYDLYYIKNVSPLLDISILFKTIMTVLSRSGR